ncbi:uncharacterized protein [Clytia hemisphaerica]|uniref:Mab-21-like HhH/H2TH-like domain-containing protein n=1 Tax=Clytia hemisphaerica TaxID=252671 RepID=A0A7M5V671_9CNID
MVFMLWQVIIVLYIPSVLDSSKLIESAIQEFQTIVLTEQAIREVGYFFLENIFNKRIRSYQKKVNITGSFNQGSLSASFFKVQDPSSSSSGYSEIDFDCQPIADFTLNEDCFADVKEIADHLRVRSRCFNHIKHRLFGNPLDDGEFITSYRIKEWAKKRLGIGRGSIFFETGVNIDRKGIKLTKATTKEEFLVTYNNMKLSVQVDFAYLIMLNFTHPLAKEFQKRTKYNLPDDLKKRSYIMAKTSHEEKNSIKSTQWSFSFSEIEDYIFTKTFSDTHKLIHLICKSIFKRVLVPLDEDKMTSYIIKTLILWRFENKTFDYCDWENETKIWEEVRLLYEHFERILKSGYLPSYFLPRQINIIKYLNTTLREIAIEKIRYKILPNLKSVIKVDIIKIVNGRLETARSLLSTLKQCFIDLNIKFPYPEDTWDNALAKLCFNKSVKQYIMNLDFERYF